MSFAACCNFRIQVGYSAVVVEELLQEHLPYASPESPKVVSATGVLSSFVNLRIIHHARN